MRASDGVKKWFDEFRKKKYAIPVGIVLAIVVCSLILVFLPGGCLTPILVAVLGFAIPYYFGLKNRKKMALYGIVLFLILGLVLGAFYFNYYKSYPAASLSSADNELVNGSVVPYRSAGPTSYTFSVMVTDDVNASPVCVVIRNIIPGDLPETNQTMDPGALTPAGRTFVKNWTLQEGVFSFRFVANTSSGWVSTSEGFGPWAVSDEALFGELLTTSMVTIWLQTATLFYLIIVLTWWMESSKKRSEQLRKRFEERKEKEAKKESGTGETVKSTVEKFVCSECGAEVPADAKKCPRCGEVFDEEAELLCTECGAKVKETDEKCWNCGKNIRK